MSATPDCRLVTIPISHYCEKARWALDRAGVRYREEAHMQVLHRLYVKRAGGKLTVPVLVTPEGVLSESEDILDYADRHASDDRRLFPDDPDEAAEARRLERVYDERLGPHGRRWMYDCLRGNRAVVMKYGTTGAPAWERRAMPLAYPLMAFVIDRVLDIDPATVAESEREFRAVFDDVGERLSDGRSYLVGDRFTAADLTFAALAAAVLMPAEYAVPLPRVDELPAEMAATVRELRELPAGRHALAMFSRERRAGAQALSS
jgi:glutathione S-transferase